jgi:V/A-type H+-transporting ATPase subunit E
MSVEAIVKRIIEEAEKEASKIRIEAEEKAKVLLKESGDKARTLKKEIIEKGKEEAEAERKRKIIETNMEGKKEILFEKRAILKELFSQSLAQLKNLEEREYLELVKSLLVNAPQEGEIIVSTQDKRITKKFLQELNKENLKISFSEEVQGGFILKGSELIVDCSFETLLKVLEEDLEPEVAKILFFGSDKSDPYKLISKR